MSAGHNHGYQIAGMLTPDAVSIVKLWLAFLTNLTIVQGNSMCPEMVVGSIATRPTISLDRSDGASGIGEAVSSL